MTILKVCKEGELLDRWECWIERKVPKSLWNTIHVAIFRRELEQPSCPHTDTRECSACLLVYTWAPVQLTVSDLRYSMVVLQPALGAVQWRPHLARTHLPPSCAMGTHAGAMTVLCSRSRYPLHRTGQLAVCVHRLHFHCSPRRRGWTGTGCFDSNTVTGGCLFS